MSANKPCELIPADIKLPESILETINGESSVYLMNPWYESDVKVLYKPKIDVNKLFDVKRTQKEGFYLNTPILLLRPNREKAEFTSNFVIKYVDVSERKGSKKFKVRRPTEQSFAREGYKHRLIINPVQIVDGEELSYSLEDRIMMKLDFAITQALEFMFVAKHLGFNPKAENCHSDKEMIEKMFEKACGSKSNEYLEHLRPEFYDFIKNPPKWNSLEKGNIEIFRDEETEDDDCFSIFELTRLIMAQEKKKKVKNGVLDTINSKAPEIFKFINDTNMIMTPSFKEIEIQVPKRDENGKNIKENGRDVMISKAISDFRFVINVDHITKPAKFPDSLLTRKSSRNSQGKLMTKVMKYDDILELNGAKSAMEENKCDRKDCYEHIKPNTRWEMRLYIRHQIEMSRFSQGQPKSLWNVDTIVYTKPKVAERSRFEIGDDEDFGDEDFDIEQDENPMEFIKPNHTLAPVEDDD